MHYFVATEAFCAMRITAQFNFYVKFYTAAMKMKTLILVCPYRPQASSAFVKYSMSPTEMPTTCENHNYIGGVMKVNWTVILNAHYEHITFVLSKKNYSF